ncbi:MAG: methyl-accepting chemotaxis protein [Pseudomonadota bacterium]
MAENTGGAGSILRNPMMLILVLLLLAAITVFAGNFYLSMQASNQAKAYLAHTNQLRVASQEIATHVTGASQGQIALFETLGDDKASFARHLGVLRTGSASEGLPASPPAAQSEIGKINSLWREQESHLDRIIAHGDAFAYLQDLAGDLAITMSAIQQENNKVVAAMLRTGAPSNQVALAQRQNLLIERMARNIDGVMTGTTGQGLPGGFSRDSANFKRVLDGMIKGDRELLLTASSDAGIRTSLTRIAELYQSITGRVNEIQTGANDVVELKASASQVQNTAGDFLPPLERLVEIYQANADSGMNSPLIGVGAAGVALFVILILAIMIYSQASRSVAESARVSQQNQAAILQLLDELADLADGDLRVQATVTENFTGSIADSINFSVDQMRGIVSQINMTSGQVSTAAEQTRSSVSQLSEASERQAKEITDVSESVNEMAVSIDKVSYNAAESSSVAERSVDIASQGAVVVQNTIDGMDNIRGQIQETAKRIKRLGESSQEIGDIVALINDIADQTNILSLNAAIQASMAGDAGKGFAVVADEVQRLAERSGAAAKQISALVKTIQSDTNEAVTSMEQTTAEVVQGTRLAQDAGVSLGEIEGVSKSLAELIENISDAARQQAASAGRISNTMKSIQEITSQTTQGTLETADAVGNLAEITDELRLSVSGFKLPDASEEEEAEDAEVEA